VQYNGYNKSQCYNELYEWEHRVFPKVLFNEQFQCIECRVQLISTLQTISINNIILTDVNMINYSLHFLLYHYHHTQIIIILLDPSLQKNILSNHITE